MPQPLRLPKRSQLLFLLTRRTACGGPTTICDSLEELVQVRTPAFACKVSIIRRGGERNGFGGTSEHVRNRVGEALEPVRIEVVFIMDDVIVRRTDCALEAVVRLKEEIKFCAERPLVSCKRRLGLLLTVNSGDTSIHNGPWPRVSILIRELRIGGEETSMVSLSADDDCQLGSVRLFSVSEGHECFADLRVLLFNDDIELPLRDSIAVNDDPAWQHPLVFLIESKALFHHIFQLGDHLVWSQPCSTSNLCRMLTSFFVS